MRTCPGLAKFQALKNSNSHSSRRWASLCPAMPSAHMPQLWGRCRGWPARLPGSSLFWECPLFQATFLNTWKRITVNYRKTQRFSYARFNSPDLRELCVSSVWFLVPKCVHADLNGLVAFCVSHWPHLVLLIEVLPWELTLWTKGYSFEYCVQSLESTRKEWRMKVAGTVRMISWLNSLHWILFYLADC